MTKTTREGNTPGGPGFTPEEEVVVFAEREICDFVCELLDRMAAAMPMVERNVIMAGMSYILARSGAISLVYSLGLSKGDYEEQVKEIALQACRSVCELAVAAGELETPKRKQFEDMTEPELCRLCNRLGKEIESICLREKVEKPMFALMLFNDPKVGQYVSNCDRESMIETLRETLLRLERSEDVPR
jgi:hypothetical protein